MRGRVCLVAALGLLQGAALLPACAQAQDAFSTIDLQLHWTRGSGPSPLHPHWHQGHGIGLGMEMPFYVGVFEAGLAVHRYATRTELPNFVAMLLYVGWGVRLPINERLNAGTTVRLGNYLMAFDGAGETFAGVSRESELAVGLGGAVTWQVLGPVSVVGRIDRLRVYTRPALGLWFYSAGLRLHLRAGEGWTDFFR